MLETWENRTFPTVTLRQSLAVVGTREVIYQDSTALQLGIRRCNHSTSG
jgi:hypothetical protein